jgi:hypothetical protein
VVRSVSALLVAALLLGGCDTTQQLNARAKLRATRVLASRKPLLVHEPDAAIRVGRVELVHRHGAAAVVVELRNVAPRALTDLPITVGLRDGRRRRVLNRRPGLAYFQTHVPAVPAGGGATWVFAAKRVQDVHGEPYAVVGHPAQPATSSLPALAVDPASALGPRVTVHLRNPTDVPQYGVQVYAFARRGARYAAAGRATVAHLGTRQVKDLRLALIGSTRGARLTLEVLPTIFR